MACEDLAANLHTATSTSVEARQWRSLQSPKDHVVPWMLWWWHLKNYVSSFRPMPPITITAQHDAATEAALIDIRAARKEYLFPLPAWAARLVVGNLKDPRDEPVAILYFNVILTAVPIASALYAAPASHVFGALYLVCLYALFLTRFLVALLHVTDHKPLFRKGELDLRLPAP